MKSKLKAFIFLILLITAPCWGQEQPSQEQDKQIQSEPQQTEQPSGQPADQLQSDKAPPFSATAQQQETQLPQKEYYPTGDLKVSWELQENKSTLLRQEFYQDSSLKNKGFFVNGYLDGVYTEYHENGSKNFELIFKNGKENGPFKEFFPSGKIKSQGDYLNGKLNGQQKIHYENGQLNQVANYKEDILNGEVLIYHLNGQLKELSTYKDGKLWGPFKRYNADGTLVSEFLYENNKKQGLFSIYYNNGTLKEKGRIVQDQVVDLQSFDERGNLKLPEAVRPAVTEPRRIIELRPPEPTYNQDVFSNDIPPQTITAPVVTPPEPPPAKKRFNLVTMSPSNKFFIGMVFLLGVLAAAMSFSAYYSLIKPNTTDIKNSIHKFLEETDNQSVDKKPPEEQKSVLDPDSPKMYRSVIETVKSGIFVTDPKGILIYSNNTFSQLLGFNTKPDVMGRNLNEISRDERFNGFLDKMNSKNTVFNHTFKHTKRDGSIAVLSTTANNIFNDRGEIIGVQGVLVDITEKFQLEQTILTEKRKLELLLDFFESIDSIRELDVLTKFVIDEISEILESQRCSLMLVEEGTLTLKVCAAKGIPEDVQKKITINWGEPIAGKVAKQGKPILVKNIEYDERFKDYKKPSSYEGRSLMAVPLDHNGSLIGVICVTDRKKEILYGETYTDVDLRILMTIASKVAISFENVRMYNDLNLLSHTDPITQIYNYRLFSDSLERELVRFKREKNDLTIFMMDLDDFKSYNDTFGHLEGDELLKNLGQILTNNLRETDIVCRYAGDEFCVVLPDTNIAGAKMAAEKVVKAVGEFPFKRKVTISIGIAKYEENLDKKDFIKRADAALYKAKHSGKNMVIIFEEESPA